MRIKWHLIRTADDLPKAGKDVLVTYKKRGSRFVYMNRATAKSDRYQDDSSWWWDQGFYEAKAIAWAELPEPFQGEVT